MAKRADPVASIRKIYNEEIRAIPYPVFMRCFDKLLVNPPEPKPTAPSEDLKKYFKTVCMAVERGVSDTERRGEDRIREFYDHVYPVWKDSLSEDEFKGYQDILDGKVREEKKRRERQMQESFDEFQEVRKKRDPGASHLRFEKAMQDALREEERREGRQEPNDRPSEKTTPEEQGELERKGGDGEKMEVPAMDSAKQLSEAILSGKVPIRYTEPENKNPLAAYYSGDKYVTLRLVRTRRSYYLYLNCSGGYSQREDAQQRVLAITSQLGYEEKDDFRYNMQGKNYTFKLKIGEKSTHLACRTETPLSREAFAKAFDQLNAHLEKIEDAFRDEGT